jgi:hypothetical protein
MGIVMAYIEPNLKLFEKKVYSQFGEDGVIEKLSKDLGIETGTYFEFGIGPNHKQTIADGLEGNFVLLRERGWKGVFLDGKTLPPEVGVRQEFITALNINELYKKHNVPDDLDFMSIDVDGQELWIWMALQYRPKVMIIEYNVGQGSEVSVSIQFNVNHKWDGTRYHGASIVAMNKIAKAKFYTLVYTNIGNAFYVRDDLVSNKSDFVFERLISTGGSHREDKLERAWVEI